MRIRRLAFGITDTLQSRPINSIRYQRSTNDSILIIYFQVSRKAASSDVTTLENNSQYQE